MAKTGEKQGEKDGDKADGGWKYALMAPMRRLRSLLNLNTPAPGTELVADKGYGGDKGDGGDKSGGGGRMLAASTDDRSKTTGSIA